MLPEIELLGVTLQTFGLVVALAFVAAGALLARRLRELGRPVDWAYEIVAVALVGGLVGAKAYFLIQNGGGSGGVFSGSGLVWYGGAGGGALAVVLWAWRRGVLGLALLDLAAPALALGYAVGRLACQLAGDGDYGRPSDLPWAMGYPHGEVPTAERVHPTPLYESLAMGLVALLLWRARDRVRPGVLFAAYLLAAGAERFLVEFLRRNQAVVAGLTGPQVISAALIVAGLSGLWFAARRGRVPVAGAEAG